MWHTCFCVNEQVSTLNIWEISRAYEETKGMFIKGAELFTIFLQEVPAVARCSLLS